MALPLARRTMAERYRANSWSFLTGVGPKVVQCGCHASCVSSSPALSPRAGAWTITAVWLAEQLPCAEDGYWTKLRGICPSSWDNFKVVLDMNVCGLC